MEDHTRCRVWGNKAGLGHVGELETGSSGETALRHVIFKVSSISSLSWLVPHLLSADDKIPSQGQYSQAQMSVNTTLVPLHGRSVSLSHTELGTVYL